MAPGNIRAALALTLALTACAGPTPSVQTAPTPTRPPTTLPSLGASPAPTVSASVVTTPAPTVEPTPAPTVEPTPAPTASASAATTPVATVEPTPAASASGPPATASAPAPTGTPQGVSWRPHDAQTTAPSAREDHTWTVDPQGGVAYLFGGRGAGGPANDLWAFDLASNTWSQVQITVDLPVPAPRFGHTATWVPGVGLVVWSGQGGSSLFFDDIWAYDPASNAWNELPALGAVPEARYGSCASLGPDGELWISHGFTADSGRFSDTRSYEFAGGTWTDRTPLSGVPVNRCLHDCFWSAGGRLILYGGQTTGVAALGDVWAYDLATGAWTRGVDPDAAPRQLYGMASDGEVGYVFGGGSLDGGFLDDTWRLDPATLELSPIVPLAGAPSPRSGAAMIHDGARSRVLLFGGTAGGGVLGDTWELPVAR